MKHLISVLILILLITSCKKEPITPGNYKPGIPTNNDTIRDYYNDGGTLPNYNGNSYKNDIANTVWVLTKVVTGFATSYPNDTITFVDNRYYRIDNNAVRPYTLTSGLSTTNKSLTLYYFYPFGGSHYAGQIGYYFASDSVMNNVEFINTEKSSEKIKAWFVRIK